MNRNAVFVALFLLTAVVASADVLSAGGARADISAADLAPADREAIVRVASDSDAAWNARDAVRLASFFTRDGDNRILGTPVELRGRDAIVSYFTGSLAKVDPAMRHVTDVRELHRITADVVASDVDVRLERTAADGTTSVVRKFSVTAILVRTDEGWKIRLNRVRPV